MSTRYGHGNGDGCGDGYGFGFGYGSGSGSGHGMGTGDGRGSGYNYKSATRTTEGKMSTSTKKKITKTKTKAKKATKRATAKNHIGKLVILRGYLSGVHIAILRDYGRKTGWIRVDGARRLWSWQGATTLDAISRNGAAETGCRVTEAVDDLEIKVSDVCEIYPMSEKAIAWVNRQPVWTL